MKKRKLTREKVDAINRKAAMREPTSTDCLTAEFIGRSRVVLGNGPDRRIEDHHGPPWPTERGSE